MEKNRINLAMAHFRRVDPVLFSIASQTKNTKEITSRKTEEYFSALCREIIGQQLAGHAARAIFGRFEDLFPERKITPELVLKMSDEKMRKAGIAWSKIKFIKDLSQKVSDGTLNLKSLEKLNDEEAAKELMKVKGIGPWTAEMFLMFTLGREDIFSCRDLGLKKAITQIYNLKNPTEEQLRKITEKWSPYRTYACCILWGSQTKKK